jgi:methionyl-tRNA formyltransferase
MRLIMMGTGPFAVPAFRGLYTTGHELAALVTRPLTPPRGTRKPPPAPMRNVAAEHGTPIYDPEDVNAPDANERLREYEADLLVVCDYGQILSAETLSTARLGGINIHGSLLPKYRGAAPVNWALYHGERETGVSLIHMTPQLDAGPVIAQGRTPIEPDETAEQLEQRLSEIGARLVLESLGPLEAGRLEPITQDASLASKAPRLKKTDGLIDWSRPALAIKNHIRAVYPWPRAYTFWHRPDGPPLRLIVGPVAVVDSSSSSVAPGTVVDVAPDRLTLQTGEDAVSLTSLQPAGKRELAIAEFLRGYQVQVGDRFGPESLENFEPSATS